MNINHNSIDYFISELELRAKGRLAAISALRQLSEKELGLLYQSRSKQKVLEQIIELFEEIAVNKNSDLTTFDIENALFDIKKLFIGYSSAEFTGKAWKHHSAANFTKEENPSPRHPNGAGKGGTIFIDFNAMIDYLEADGREWYIAELDLNKTPILFDMGNFGMATILTDLQSEKGFFPFYWQLDNKCQHEFVAKEYKSQSQGTCISCKKIITD